ncbi:MAG: glycosyltransferase [Saprospiraceae bacterium]|jgi:GT2 family glycosyltransferase|nr:glycosyltransferase [Saprospiraceae bacterium]
MKLTIIIVNYNVQYFLEQALLSAQKAIQNIDAEIYVVDNNSSDNSVQLVRKKFPSVKLIANSDNPGFSKANNQAIRASNAEYILLLNPDTIVTEDTFEKCIQFMDQHPDIGGLGVKMIDGSGNFLPESKRGFPSPWVAFCKTFGLSKIFPKSRLFNRYHLGFLDKEETHEIDILAGAFMMVRRETLDKIGLLDETFFMYGEDIDWSYRIQLGGYKNYYFADTQIVHYKGESTKKGSLNYVKVFYNAMIIFAKKHFKGSSAKGFVWSLQLAIYFRAFLTLVSNIFRKGFMPLLDAALIVGGLVLIKDFWATHYYNDPDYYSTAFYYFNIPLYTFLWLSAVFFTGGYDDRFNIRRMTRGFVIGTILLAAVYGFLPLDLRPSRAIIAFGAIWALISTTTLRTSIHFFKYGNFNVGRNRIRNLIIVGSKMEAERALGLLQKAEIQKNYIGIVAPKETKNLTDFLGGQPQLEELVQIYKIDEILFCLKDVSAKNVMNWMVKLGNQIEYKTLSEGSQSIIGSSSKDTTGQLYTIETQFNIATQMARRNKRTFDLFLAILLFAFSPILLFFVQNKSGFFNNIFQVLRGRKSWVGYVPSTEKDTQSEKLPKTRKGVLSSIDVLDIQDPPKETIRRINFWYAKDYALGKDLNIIWKGFFWIGNS